MCGKTENEEASPKVKGSSAENGNDPRGFASSEDNVAEQNEEVKALSAEKENFKEKQFKVIQNSNPADDNCHTWIRSAEEIKKQQETIDDPEWDYDEYDPDCRQGAAFRIPPNKNIPSLKREDVSWRSGRDSSTAVATVHRTVAKVPPFESL